MSYILDALRKSDQQRQRGTSPTLLTAHAAPEASRRFAYIVYGTFAAILLLAGIGIGWFHPWQQETPAPAPIVQTPPLTPVEIKPREVATVRAPAEPPRKPETEPPARKAAAPTPPVTPAPSPASAQLAATPSSIAPVIASPPITKSEIKGLVPATVVTAPPAAPAAQQLANASPPAPPAEQPIVAFADLPFQIRQEIPRLSIAVHAYSKEPKNRLVTIDNRLLHEGDEAAPGLRLEQITSDGMVFDYKGYRFKRSVQDVVNNR